VLIAWNCRLWPLRSTVMQVGDFLTTWTNRHRGHRDSCVAASTTIGVAASRKADAAAGHAETNFRLATMRKRPSTGMLSS
jgi:hypothetical protein